jgi:hypothetical protein
VAISALAPAEGICGPSPPIRLFRPLWGTAAKNGLYVVVHLVVVAVVVAVILPLFTGGISSLAMLVTTNTAPLRP